MGADLRVPGIYRPIMKWVTPLFLFVLLGWWGIREAVPTLMMETVEDPATVPYRWASRLLIVGMLAAGLYLVRRAWLRRGLVTAPAVPAVGPEPGPPGS